MSKTVIPSVKKNTAAAPFLNSAISISVSIAAAACCLAAQSDEPYETLSAFFIAPFTNLFYLGNMLDRASLILLCALGFIIPSKAGFFNLGGEGQAAAGALIAVEFALLFPSLPQPLGLVLGCTLAAAGAGILGLLSACLKHFLAVTELISTYLVSCALLPLIDYGINEVFRDPTGNLMATPYTAESWYFASFWKPSTLNSGIFFAAGAAFFIFWMFRRTRYGYELRLTGGNCAFAQSQGIKVASVSILALSLGTACHGLAGAFAVYGSRHYVYSGITAGIGWSGISAALIGRTHPLGAIFGALFFAWIEAGGKAAMIHSTVTFDLSAVVQGIAFMLVTVDFFRRKKEDAVLW